MQKVTVNGVLKTQCDGSRVWAGYTTEEAVPGLHVAPVDMLDPEDATDARWVLANPEPVHLLTIQELETLSAGELRRSTLAKLTDAELASIGVTRE